MVLVALDARRQRDNGIARVTRLLVQALERGPHDPLLLGPAQVLAEQHPGVAAIEYTAPLLSTADLYGLDDVLKAHGVECFIAPQYYCSPWTHCPQVRILHDTFPLELGAKLTTSREAEAAFGFEQLRDLFEALVGEPYEGSEGSAKRAYARYYEFSLKSANVLLTVSRQSRQAMLKHFPALASRMEVIPLYPDPAVCDFKAPITGRPLDLIHVSKFEPRKNQLFLPEVWSQIHNQLPSLRASIVGSPSPLFPTYGQEVLRKIRVAVDQGWLSHYARIDDGALRGLYVQTKICCSPSTAEGYGLPALEALANGCVVLTSTGTAMDEIGGGSILGVGAEEKMWVDTLLSLLSDSSALVPMARAGREWALAQTPQAMSAAISASIDAAVSDPTHGSNAFRPGSASSGVMMRPRC